MATLLLNLFTPMQYDFWFKGGYFPPLKHSSYGNVSKSNNQFAVAHNKNKIRKSVKSFVASKPASVVSCNFIRPDFANNLFVMVPVNL